MFSGLRKTYKSFSRAERLIALASLAAFAVSGFFLLINIWANKTMEVPVKGGTYRHGLVGQPNFINPVLLKENEPDSILTGLLFSNIVALSESIEPSADGKVWNIRLKDKLFWHDNTPISSDDVIFTLETIQKPETGSGLFPDFQGVKWSRVSEREFIIELAGPYAFFEKNLEDLRPIPKHLFSDIPASNIRISNFNLEPVGSGPFHFVSLTKRNDGFITEHKLERFENYFGDQPYLDELILKFFPNSQELVKAINNGNIDGLLTSDDGIVQKIDIPHDVSPILLPRYYAVFFNPYASEALKDKNVREALNYATNKEKIVSSIFGGHAQIVDGPIPFWTEGYQEKRDFLFSLDEAKSILQRAGFKLDLGGVMVKIKGPDNKPLKLEFTLYTPETLYLVKTAEILKEDWSLIGVKLNINKVSSGGLENIIRTRNYEMILFGNFLGRSPDLYSFWHSSQRFYPGLNLTLYDNKNADALIERLRGNLNNDSRGNQLKELQLIIENDKPAIFLFSPPLFLVTRNLYGFNEKMAVSPVDIFSKASSWYIKTARVFR